VVLFLGLFNRKGLYEPFQKQGLGYPDYQKHTKMSKKQKGIYRKIDSISFVRQMLQASKLWLQYSNLNH
jgi:hypothetical protein